MAGKSPSDEHLATIRLSHLNMIQGIISRVSGFSANAKNFCITILAAVIGISFQYRLRLSLLLLAAVFVVFVFGALDTYYLAQERRFRGFYNDVTARPLANAHQLDLDPPKLDFGKYLSAIRSFSTGGYYALLLIATGALLLIAYGRSDEARVGSPSSASGASGQQRAANVAAGGGANAGAIDASAGADVGRTIRNDATAFSGGGSPTGSSIDTTARADAGKPFRNVTAPEAGGTVRGSAKGAGVEPVRNSTGRTEASK